MELFQNVLILDDEPGFREELKESLSENGYHVYTASLPSEALLIIESQLIDTAVFDIRLPEMDGLTLLKKIKQDYPHIEVIMMTGFGDMDSVITALRSGAIDYLNKPFKLSELKVVLDKVFKYKSVKYRLSEDEKLQDQLLSKEIKIIGESRVMKEIFNVVNHVANTSDTTVLISGESGTGKELLAKSIHYLSARKNNRFIPVNCSTIPEDLFENEFFGHSRGSYTDAKNDQKGLFEIADKGTLFLDEIGDLKYNMQAKLLRVIEDKKISRIGEYSEVKVDVRVIAATNQDIDKMIEEKRFRNDLYHRLNMFRIDIPPLRERKEDIPLLFDYFVSDLTRKLSKPIKKIEKSIISKLMNYDFPGNVRELRNITEKGMIMCDCEILSEKCFTILDVLSNKNKLTKLEPDDFMTLDQVELNSIMGALRKSKNNKSRAALMLKISRQALDRKIKKYNINLK
jgi:DNA-binding NtrC family response regulator